MTLFYIWAVGSLVGLFAWRQYQRKRGEAYVIPWWRIVLMPVAIIVVGVLLQKTL